MGQELQRQLAESLRLLERGEMAGVRENRLLRIREGPDQRVGGNVEILHVVLSDHYGGGRVNTRKRAEIVLQGIEGLGSPVRICLQLDRAPLHSGTRSRSCGGALGSVQAARTAFLDFEAGDPGRAAGYVLASVVLSLGAAAAGYYLGRSLA